MYRQGDVLWSRRRGRAARRAGARPARPRRPAGPGPRRGDRPRARGHRRGPDAALPARRPRARCSCTCEGTAGSATRSTGRSRCRPGTTAWSASASTCRAPSVRSSSPTDGAPRATATDGPTRYLDERRWTTAEPTAGRGQRVARVRPDEHAGRPAEAEAGVRHGVRAGRAGRPGAVLWCDSPLAGARAAGPARPATARPARRCGAAGADRGRGRRARAELPPGSASSAGPGTGRHRPSGPGSCSPSGWSPRCGPGWRPSSRQLRRMTAPADRCSTPCTASTTRAWLGAFDDDRRRWPAWPGWPAAAGWWWPYEQVAVLTERPVARAPGQPRPAAPRRRPGPGLSRTVGACTPGGACRSRRRSRPSCPR